MDDAMFFSTHQKHFEDLANPFKIWNEKLTKHVSIFQRPLNIKCI